MSTEIKLQVGVKALLQNKEGKYLLLRRSLEKYPEIQGRWDIVGGRIDPGTTLIENLKREIREETNLELTGEPMLIAAQDIIPNSEKHVVRLTYIGKAEGGVKLDTSENDMYQWCTLGEIEGMEGVDRYFRELLDRGVVRNEVGRHFNDA